MLRAGHSHRLTTGGKAVTKRSQSAAAGGHEADSKLRNSASLILAFAIVFTFNYYDVAHLVETTSQASANAFF